MCCIFKMFVKTKKQKIEGGNITFITFYIHIYIYTLCTHYRIDQYKIYTFITFRPVQIITNCIIKRQLIPQ